MAQLGRVAKVGDEIKIDGGTLRVERMDARRIDRIRFSPDQLALIEDAATEGSGGEAND
jgi:hypothetical protein